MGFTYIDPAPVSLAPTGQTFHKRAVVTGAAGTLGSFISGGIPSYADPNDNSRKYVPFMVQLQAESGTDACYVTFDGQSTPSATLGFQVAEAPAISEVPCPAGLADNVVKLFSAGTSNVQCWFKMVSVGA